VEDTTPLLERLQQGEGVENAEGGTEKEGE
jgi:hypothetical protein